MSIRVGIVQLLAAPILALLAILWLAPTPGHAQSQVDLVLSGAPAIPIGLNETFDLLVSIQPMDAGATYNLAQVVLSYDPDVLTPVDVEELATSGINPIFGLTIGPNFDLTNGRIAYSVATQGAEINTTVDILRITFETTGNALSGTEIAFLTGDDTLTNVLLGVEDVTGTTDPVTVFVDSTVPVTLGWFLAEETDDGVLIQWQTATESGSAGFNILAGSEEEELQPLNPALIPSKVIDSVEPTDYDFSAVTDATVYFLQEVALSGVVSQMGPFDLGQTYGVLIEDDGPIDDSSEMEEHHQIYLPLISGW